MHRGSLIAGVCSLVGSGVATAVVLRSGEWFSMYTAIAVVLLLNAAVRLRLARSHRAHHRPR